MSIAKKPISRRNFVASAALGALSAATLNANFAFAAAAPTAKYRRYNVASPQGQKALASYAKGVEAMLKLPPTHPHNWFRNAFIHFMDCPHGNWWFYVWHRGYLGYFEQTIRKLSGDPTFAIPYWDWTQSPQIPDAMFDGVLNPASSAFAATTDNLGIFAGAMRSPLRSYMNTLTPAQVEQLVTRGYSSLDLLWNDVTGYDPKSKTGVSGNMAFAAPCGARFLTRANPKLDEKTAYDCSPFVVTTGLFPKQFWSSDGSASFTSSRTASHTTAPDGATKFSILEGMPHNKTHNYVGGVGPLDPGPYGNMANNLSPIDPLFFLHHSNMDRLWTVWEQKQKRLGLPSLPAGADLDAFSNEPFLFFVDSDGQFKTTAKAGDFIDAAVFGYDYEPGFGSNLASGNPLVAAVGHGAKAQVQAVPAGGTWSASVPAAVVAGHLAQTGSPLVAEVTLSRPSGPSDPREFDVLINAPEGVTAVDAGSPYFAGTIAFFGPVMSHGMHAEHMSGDATFAVPIPRQPALFTEMKGAASPLKIRVVPSQSAISSPTAPTLKTVTIKSL